jgi:hypothetical protein
LGSIVFVDPAVVTLVVVLTDGNLGIGIRVIMLIGVGLWGICIIVVVVGVVMVGIVVRLIVSLSF